MGYFSISGLVSPIHNLVILLLIITSYIYIIFIIANAFVFSELILPKTPGRETSLALTRKNKILKRVIQTLRQYEIAIKNSGF